MCRRDKVSELVRPGQAEGEPEMFHLTQLPRTDKFILVRIGQGKRGV